MPRNGGPAGGKERQMGSFYLIVMAVASVFFGLHFLMILPALARMVAGLVSGVVKWPGPRVHDLDPNAATIRQRLGVGFENLFPTFLRHGLTVLAGLAYSLLGLIGFSRGLLAPAQGSEFFIWLLTLAAFVGVSISIPRAQQHAAQVLMLLSDRASGGEPRHVDGTSAEAEYAIEHPLLGRQFGVADSPRALNIFNEGTTRYQAGGQMAALSFYQEALQFDPSLHQHACEALAKLAPILPPVEAGAAYYWLGIHSEYLTNRVQAAEWYQKAIQAYAQLGYSHRESRCHCNLGNVKLQMHDPTGMDEFERAIALNPSNGTAHMNIGVTYYRISGEGDPRFERALDAFADAIVIDPRLYGPKVIGRMREHSYEWKRDLEEVDRRVTARQQRMLDGSPLEPPPSEDRETI